MRAMNRRAFLGCLGAAAACALPPAAARPAKPNFLFLFADDMTREALHALGGGVCETPNLDRLAARGVLFSQAYNMGGWHGAICVASRTMLVTGAYMWHAKQLERRLDKERAAGRLWPQLMAAAGYETYMAGKWHVQIDPASIFDHTGTVRGGMAEDRHADYNRPLEGVPDAWSPSDPARGGYWEGGTHWSVKLADEAIGFLGEAAGKPKPFFMYIAFNAPHDPRQSPQEYLDRYLIDKIPVPENFLPENPHKDIMGCGKALRDEALASFPRTEFAVRTHRREYYAIVSHLDAQIGRILDALEASGKADTTYIVFAADNGLACGRHGLMGKQSMYEHSMGVPLCIVGPGVAAGVRMDAPVYFQDLVPTVLELAGAAIPASVEFRPLTPCLTPGGSYAPREVIYGAYMERQRMIVSEGFKLIYYPEDKTVLLFDLKKDPFEKNDLSGVPEYAGTVEKLQKLLAKTQVDMGDPI